MLLHHQMSVNRVSTERQQYVNSASTVRQQCVNSAATEHQQSVNRPSALRQQSVNRVSRILGITSCIIQGLWYGRYPQSVYWRLFWAKVNATWSQPHCENERQQRMNDFVCYSMYNPRDVIGYSTIIKVSAAIIGNIMSVDTVTPQNERQLSVNSASTEHQLSVNRASTERQQSIYTVSTECKQSVNAFGCCMIYNRRALLWYRPIINILAAILCKCDRDMVTTPVWKWASAERQSFCVLHFV
jgi:hypothetical protein